MKISRERSKFSLLQQKKNKFIALFVNLFSHFKQEKSYATSVEEVSDDYTSAISTRSYSASFCTSDVMYNFRNINQRFRSRILFRKAVSQQMKTNQLR